jgi:hypothetical protein
MALKTAADAMGIRANEEKTTYVIVNGKKIHRTAESDTEYYLLQI